MDVHKALRELYEEKKRLDMMIAVLERKLIVLDPPKRRGRSSMTPEERAAVSRRMQEYWAKRRQAENEDKT